jgi:hypothetical protein
VKSLPIAVIQGVLSAMESTLKGRGAAAEAFLPRSVVKWAALAALPPLPQTKIRRPSRPAFLTTSMTAAISAMGTERIARSCAAT